MPVDLGPARWRGRRSGRWPGRAELHLAVVPVVCSIDMPAALRFRHDRRWMRASLSDAALLADGPMAGCCRRSLEIARGMAQVPITLSIVPC
jgi:hypothetical protein